MAARGVPGEQFSFTLSLDANDLIANGQTNPVAASLASASGVYPRLAALEMLQYPTSDSGAASLLGSVSASISAAGASAGVSATAASRTTPVPRSEVPTVLFVWGPQRIVPVRLTALSITEKLYDAALNPIQADVHVTLRVLTPEELASIQGELREVARVAYAYSQGLRQVEATANLADAATSILGMLPTPF
jgi:hypothetical protein